MSADVLGNLACSARMQGWTEEPNNSLSYYNLKLSRPEPDGRKSTLLLRVTHRVVEMRCDIGGLQRTYTVPSPSRVREMLSAKPPQPTTIHPSSDAAGHDLTALRSAVDNWNTGLDHHGHALHRAASDLLRRIEEEK